MMPIESTLVDSSFHSGDDHQIELVRIRQAFVSAVACLTSLQVAFMMVLGHLAHLSGITFPSGMAALLLILLLTGREMHHQRQRLRQITISQRINRAIANSPILSAP